MQHLLRADLVSVVIPCYNAAECVGEAIQSVLDQTYAPMEIIVVDDGSTDETLDVIRSFGEHITWRAGENRGACHARNQGLHLASGAYVQFLDADDMLLPDKVAHQMRLVEKATSRPDLVVAGYRKRMLNGSEHVVEVGEVDT